MTILLFLLLHLVVSSPAESYNEANRLYEEGDYAGAIDLYEQVLPSTRNERVLFNLGNAYFKSGRIGEAVLSYKRAWLLSPRDPDVSANLAFARSYRADKVENRKNPLVAVFSSALRFFSVRESFLAASALFLLGSILLSIAVVRRLRAFRYASLAVFVVFLYFILSWVAWQAVTSGRSAAVVVSEATAYSGPGDDYREVLKVHDGLEVRIRDERHGFVLVQIPSGLGGWVEESAVEEVLPAQK